MRTSRLFLPVVGMALLLGAGCTTRRDKVLIQELRSENARLTGEISALQESARSLETERNFLLEENARLREQTKGLSETVRRFGSNINIEGITVDSATNTLNLDQDFAFATGSAQLKAEGQNAIKRLAELLNGGEYRDTKIFVEGHTDDVPVSRPETIKAFTDNWGLSAMRAAAVVRALQQNGVNPNRLRGTFRGEYAPRKSGKTSADRAANRRVEISLSL